MSWRDHTRVLVEQGRLHKVFGFTADDNARTALERVRIEIQGESLSYEPLLFESWLQDVAQLADRVLAYRREARELEILAVKAIMDHDLGQNLIEIDRKIQTVLVQKSVKARAKLTQDAAAAEFHKQADQGGFFALASGRSAELEVELNDANQQLNLIDERWQVQNNYQETYWAKNNDDGNAHNYAQRALRVYQLIGEDLTEAYAKAAAIREGIATVHQKELPDIPPTKPQTFIDDFVLWIRSAIRWAEWSSQYKVEFDLVIPLTQPWSRKQVPILRPEVLRAALERAKTNRADPVSVDFQLEDDLFVDRKRPRLTGLGLSYGNQEGIIPTIGIDKNATADSYVRVRAVVHTPEQTAGGRTYRRPPLVLGCLGVFAASAPLAFEKGDAVANINPAGQWTIDLYSSMVYKDDSAKDITDGIYGKPMLDLKLHLRLRTCEYPK